jgi:predicted DCC family thiol-disulfide oxidoreductase YuxK
MPELIDVYYDGHCGICRREIDYYRSIAPKDTFIWHDIMDHKDALEKIGISLEAALMALHVKDRRGLWHKGTDAFIVIWRKLPSWRLKFLARLFSLPILHGIACWGYHILAKSRFKKNGYCNLE